MKSSGPNEFYLKLEGWYGILHIAGSQTFG